MPLPFVKVKIDNDDSDDMLDVEVYVSRAGVPLPPTPTAVVAVPPGLTVDEDLEFAPETTDCIAARVKIGALPEETFDVGVWHNSAGDYSWVAVALAITYERDRGDPNWTVHLQLEGFDPSGGDPGQPKLAQVVFTGQLS